MAESHDSRFVINDIELEIPPTAIQINRNARLRELKALRNRSSKKVKSGQSSVIVNVVAYFVGKEAINNQFRRLIAQLRLTPFCYVENQKLRDSIFGGEDTGQNMALALQNLTAMTIPGHPESLEVHLSFVWFNYLPYTPNFYFKREPFVPLGQKSPGVAFQYFYAPQLKQHVPITFQNSNLTAEINEFLISGKESFSDEISLDVNKPKLEDFQSSLNEYLSLLSEFSNNAESDFLLDSRSSFSPTDPTALAEVAGLREASILIESADPTINNTAFIGRTIENASRVTAALENSVIETAGSQDKTNQLLKKIVSTRDQLLNKGGVIFAGGTDWIEFPKSLAEDNNEFKTIYKDDPSSLYYRREKFTMGQDDETVVEQIVVSFSHHLVQIPLAGHQYPTIQYMGSSDMRVVIKGKALSDTALRNVSRLWNLQQNNALNARYVPQQYTNLTVRNEMFQLMGLEDVIVESYDEQTIEGYPGTYDFTLGFVESGIELENEEGLKIIPTSFHEVRKAIWRAVFENLIVDTASLSDVPGAANVSVVKIVPGGEVLERAKGRETAEINILKQLLYNKPTGLIWTVENALFFLLSQNIDPSIDVGYQSSQYFGANYNPGSYQYRRIDGQEDPHISAGFRNLLIFSSLNDDDILGIEGMTDILWQVGDVRSRSGGYLILPSDKTKDPFTQGAGAQRQHQRMLRESRLKTAAERYKALTAAKNKIDEFRSALHTGEQVSSTTVKTLTGELIDITRVLDDAGLTKNFKEQVIAAGQRDWLAPPDPNEGGIGATIRRAIGNSFIGQASVGDEQEDFIIDMLDQLEAELEGSNKLIENGFRPGSIVDKLNHGMNGIREWAAWSAAQADEIMHSNMINLPMFAEAKKMLEAIRAGTGGKVYRDFPLDEIRDLIQASIGASADIANILEVEPDFYFLNETADQNIAEFLPEDKIETARHFQNKYADEVVKNDSNWFNQVYLNKVNPPFAAMLRQSAGDKEDLTSSNTGLSSVAASTTFTNPLTIARKSSVNAKTVNGRNINGQFSLNNIPEKASPRAVHTISSSDTPSAVALDEAAGMSVDPLYADAAEIWQMPVKGNFRISSWPGYRNVEGGSRYHPGIDIAHRPAGRNSSLGRPVYAAATGTIDKKNTNASLSEGLSVGIISNTAGEAYRHQYFHLHAHASGYEVGDTISKGTLLGWIGTTGSSTAPHLHFEVRRYDGQDFTETVYPLGTYQDENINEDPARPILRVPLIRWEGNNIPVVPQHSLETNKSTFDLALDSIRSTWNKTSGYRMNRAYPGIYMSFTEENLGRNILRFDAFFNYSSIISMEMVRDREVAADYCRMALTNVSGILSNRKFQGTYNEEKVQGKKRVSPIDKNTAKETTIDSLMLSEGMKVEVRLGYSNNPDNLALPFVGRIVSVQFDETDDVVLIEMQSLATELVQTLKGQDEAEVYSNTYGSNEADTGHLLTSLISSPECVSFGMWKRGDRIHNTNRDLLTDRWEWKPNPATDNIFVPPKDEMRALDPGLVFDKMKYFMYQYTIWDVFKEMELRHPEYISYAVPYQEANGTRTRMTIFFGLPDQLYFNRDPSLSEQHEDGDIQLKKKLLKSNLTSSVRNGNFLRGARDLLTRAGVQTEDAQELLRKAAKATSSTPNPVSPFGYSDNPVAEQEDQLNNVSEEITDLYVESQRLKGALEGGAIQPFRRYHLLTSEQHIVSNSIKPQASKTFNAVTVKYADPGSGWSLSKITSGGGLISGVQNLTGTDFGASDAVGIDDQGAPKIKDGASLTMKLDPQIPDENVRQNYMVFPNCIGEEMAKRYCVSVLQKATWQIYQGEIVILGNPDIKPYDICYLYDSYNDIRGAIQVRRVAHFFSHEDGFISVITPDCFATVTEGSTMTQNQAMGLMAETLLNSTFKTQKFNIVTPGRTPLDATQTTPFLYEASVLGGKLVNFFGGKRLIFNTQFKEPIRVYPLMKHGRPMVAGFGPPHLLNNLHWWDELKSEVQTGLDGLNEWMDEFSSRLHSGRFFQTRGTFFGEEGTRRIRTNQN